MDYQQIINGVMQQRVGEFIVTDKNGDILFRNHVEPFSNAQWEDWVDFNLEPEKLETEEKWEISDKKKNSYYSVISVPVTAEREELIVHHVFNTTEYATLLRDVSQYSREWKNLSSFQSRLFEKLSEKYTEGLPIILKALHLKSIALFIGRDKYTEEYLIKKGEEGLGFKKTDDRSHFSAVRNQNYDLFDDGEKWICFINDVTIDGVNYALFFENGGEINEEEYAMYYHVIRLFLENALLRERIIYESEHDQLTGLSNKGKYLSMMEDFFPNCERIAIYNMDLNYLKRVNDSLGHEAGDALLIKAAKSLLAVEGEKVRGFRMGGDEYMLLAWDLDEAQAEDLRTQWQQALDKLNKEDTTLECVVACGLAYGAEGHDLKELLKLADERMYENKVAIKTARGDDPNSR